MRLTYSFIQAGLLGISVLFASELRAEEACPKLMVLERSTNLNRIWYTAGAENPNSPIVAKWEMRENGPDKWENLTTLEQNKAYGVKIQSVQNGETRFNLAAMKEYGFTLKTDKNTNCPYVSYLQKEGPEMNVQTIVLSMKKSLIPAVAKIEFFGRSMNDDRELHLEFER